MRTRASSRQLFLVVVSPPPQLRLLKNGVQQVSAKKKRFGKDPFTGEERWFDAKPASVKLKVRPLKKLKDAAA